MENKKRDENLLVTLSSRRKVNAKNQLKSVLLEMMEIFGLSFVLDVIDECKGIYSEYIDIVSNEGLQLNE